MEITGNDFVYTIIGAVGLGSVVLVLYTAFNKVNSREVKRARARKELEQKLAGLKGNLEPEEKVLE